MRGTGCGVSSGLARARFPVLAHGDRKRPPAEQEMCPLSRDMCVRRMGTLVVQTCVASAGFRPIPRPRTSHFSAPPPRFSQKQLKHAFQGETDSQKTYSEIY